MDGIQKRLYIGFFKSGHYVAHKRRAIHFVPRPDSGFERYTSPHGLTMQRPFPTCAQWAAKNAAPVRCSIISRIRPPITSARRRIARPLKRQRVMAGGVKG